MRAQVQDTSVPELLHKAAVFFKSEGVYNSFLKTYITEEGYTFKQAEINKAKFYYITLNGEALLDLHVVGTHIGYKLHNEQKAGDFFRVVESKQEKKAGKKLKI